MKTILLWIGAIVAGLIAVQIALALLSLITTGLWAGVGAIVGHRRREPIAA
jgi:hypothetical protein